MKVLPLSLLALFAAALPVAAVDLPEDMAGAPGSGRDSGFRVRSAQAMESPPPPRWRGAYLWCSIGGIFSAKRYPDR